MTAFRIFLIILWVIIAAYTGLVIAQHGMNLMPIFFGDMAKMAWPGQFNLDFFCLLLLSGLWVAWRHHFSAGALLLGLIAVNLGAFFMTAYLLVISIQAKGDMRVVLIGTRR
jgi:hypothetical protein